MLDMVGVNIDVGSVGMVSRTVRRRRRRKTNAVGAGVVMNGRNMIGKGRRLVVIVTTTTTTIAVRIKTTRMTMMMTMMKATRMKVTRTKATPVVGTVMAMAITVATRQTTGNATGDQGNK